MTSFADKIDQQRTSLLDKEKLARQIVENGQFLIGEQPKIVRNGLSTDLLVFPSDMHASHRGLLHEKVNAAIEYAASFTDVERLNALQYLPGPYKEQEDSQGRWYLTLGLYLYFADECSRKNPNMTFLTALREADAKLPGDKGYTQIELAAKVLKALEIAHINTHTNVMILQDWMMYGSYTIAKHPHQPGDAPGAVEGAYAQLAKKLVEKYHHLHQRGIIVGVNEAISYALGNKEHMENLQREANNTFQNDATLDTDKKREEAADKLAYQHVLETVTAPARHHLIEQHVKQGCNIRRHRIMDMIHNQESPLFSATEIAASERSQSAFKHTAEKILSWFPPEALELMLREKQTFVYDDKETIRGVFPAGDVPNLNAEKSEQSRDSIAVRMHKYRAVFFSNGKHEDAQSVDRETKLKRVAQSSLHELMHVAYGMMTDDEKAHLEELAKKVSLQLWGYNGSDLIIKDGHAYFYEFFTAGGKIPDRTEVLETRSLPEILDYRSGLYNGYRKDPEKPNTLDTRIEEVICNTYGFIHTEFKDRADPANLLWNNPQGLEAMREFAQAVDDTFAKVVERMRHEKSILQISGGHARE